MNGQSNDVYEEMDRSRKVSQLPGGMAILYASAPIFSPTSKDPEGKDEVYQILPEAEAVQQGVNSRRYVYKLVMNIPPFVDIYLPNIHNQNIYNCLNIQKISFFR
jgi:hypothetical protein